MTSSFEEQVRDRVAGNASDGALSDATKSFLHESIRAQYSYNFSWMGRPIIQYPQDMIALQELVWEVKPDLIIEAGIAHGGSLILSASLLTMLDCCDAIESARSFDPAGAKRRVLGLDIDIRPHNRAAIEAHPMSARIDMIEGSSIAPEIVDQVKKYASGYEKVMVCLDSNHTHSHVLSELEAYAPLTSVGSYCVVFDTVVEDLPSDMFPNRSWGPGDNPKTAVWKYLEDHPEFEVDTSVPDKLQVTVAPDGYLKRTS